MDREVFFSFHFDNDVMRVQQVRNIGAITNDEPLEPNEWETISDGGKAEIEKWIDKNLKGKDCLVVLIGEDTHERPWVDLEIRKAWRAGIPLMGIHIHNLKCPNNGICNKGRNPFANISIDTGGTMADYITVHDPNSKDAYNDIKKNIEAWVEAAIKKKNKK